MFSIIGITNYHKFSSLKTHNFIMVLCFRSLRLLSLGSNQSGSRAVFLSQGSKVESISLTFPDSWGCPHSSGPLIHHQRNQYQISDPSSIIKYILTPLSLPPNFLSLSLCLSLSSFSLFDHNGKNSLILRIYVIRLGPLDNLG